MRRIRVIPVLSISGNRLVKTVKFKKETYIGDPINAIKIFNDKEVDELVALDIHATKNNTPPNFKLIEEFASECFMPLAYGGGITSMEQIHKIFGLGVEKIIVNSSAATTKIIEEATKHYGSQSIVASVDVNKSMLGKQYIATHSGKHKIKTNLLDYVKTLEEQGAGEIIVNAIYNDGMMDGYDIDLIKMVADHVNIPVVACGGASKIDDFLSAVNHGHASAVAAGSQFVYSGPQKGVLINYPNQEKLESEFYQKVER